MGNEFRSEGCECMYVKSISAHVNVFVWVGGRAGAVFCVLSADVG